MHKQINSAHSMDNNALRLLQWEDSNFKKNGGGLDTFPSHKKLLQIPFQKHYERLVQHHNLTQGEKETGKRWKETQIKLEKHRVKAQVSHENFSSDSARTHMSEVDEVNGGAQKVDSYSMANQGGSGLRLKRLISPDQDMRWERFQFGSTAQIPEMRIAYRDGHFVQETVSQKSTSPEEPKSVFETSV